MTTIDTDTLNGEDIIDVRDIIARVEELEDNQNTPEAKEEFIFLSTILHELCGYGGDEQWRGDWYPVTLIRETHFTDYCEELVCDCYDLKGVPSFVHIDWEATARDMRVDYSEVDIDGVTYFYR